MKFYKCIVCGKVLAHVGGPESGVVCCWMPMREVALAGLKVSTGAAADLPRCGFDDSSCVPPARHEGAYLYAQARRYL